jgi:hypothetical protein
MKRKSLSASDVLLLSANNRAVDKFCKATPGRTPVKGSDIGICHGLDDHGIGREFKYAGYDRTPEGVAAWEQTAIEMHAKQQPIELASLKPKTTEIERG